MTRDCGWPWRMAASFQKRTVGGGTRNQCRPWVRLEGDRRWCWQDLHPWLAWSRAWSLAACIRGPLLTRGCGAFSASLWPLSRDGVRSVPWSSAPGLPWTGPSHLCPEMCALVPAAQGWTGQGQDAGCLGDLNSPLSEGPDPPLTCLQLDWPLRN